MPLDFLKRWIFNAELKKSIILNSASSELVGVFINYPLIVDDVLKLEKSLFAKGIKKENIRVLAFDNKVESTNVIYKTYNLKNLKWAGYPQSTDIDEFLKTKYKKFYYLASSYEDHQKFILSKVQAEFKAGIHFKGIEQYLDFIIDAPFQNIDQSFKEINKTIEKITKQ
jgi:hypothetical protein